MALASFLGLASACQPDDTRATATVPAAAPPNFNAKDLLRPDRFVQPYADSVNRLVPPGRVPRFLYQKNFDYRQLLWANAHEPLSLRHLLVERITNLDALLYLRDKQDRRMMTPPYHDPLLLLPFRAYSFHDLLVLRINELRQQESCQHSQDRFRTKTK
jgi:hypothetical protein